jgi:hypothetical protein
MLRQQKMVTVLNSWAFFNALSLTPELHLQCRRYHAASCYKQGWSLLCVCLQFQHPGTTRSLVSTQAGQKALLFTWREPRCRTPANSGCRIMAVLSSCSTETKCHVNHQAGVYIFVTIELMTKTDGDYKYHHKWRCSFTVLNNVTQPSRAYTTRSVEWWTVDGSTESFRCFMTVTMLPW